MSSNTNKFNPVGNTKSPINTRKSPDQNPNNSSTLNTQNHANSQHSANAQQQANTQNYANSIQNTSQIPTQNPQNSADLITFDIDPSQTEILASQPRRPRPSNFAFDTRRAKGVIQPKHKAPKTLNLNLKNSNSKCASSKNSIFGSNFTTNPKNNTLNTNFHRQLKTTTQATTGFSQTPEDDDRSLLQRRNPALYPENYQNNSNTSSSKSSSASNSASFGKNYADFNFTSKSTNNSINPSKNTSDSSTFKFQTSPEFQSSNFSNFSSNYSSNSSNSTSKSINSNFTSTSGTFLSPTQPVPKLKRYSTSNTTTEHRIKSQLETRSYYKEQLQSYGVCFPSNLDKTYNFSYSAFGTV